LGMVADAGELTVFSKVSIKSYLRDTL
jgi:hypothetical protein